MTFFDYYLRGADSDTTRAALLAAGAIVALPADGQRLCDVSGDGFDVDETRPGRPTPAWGCWRCNTAA